jgi:GT2 family glycosyltransferase
MPASPPDPRLPRGSALTLAVVVPATDDPPAVGRCLAALEGGERAPDEIVVQREPTGIGPAAARNLGAAETTAEVVVFVDSDVEVGGDALNRIEQRFREDPDLAAVFGAYDDDPADPGVASRYRNLLHHHVHAGAAGEAETFWAGLGAVRREALEDVGGFDADRYPRASIEDIELGMRLRQRGHRILLDPLIRGRHLKRWTVASMVRTDFGRRGVPWARLLLRQRSGSTALNLGWRQRLSAATSIALLASLLTRRPRTAMAALLGNLALDRGLYALLARRGGPRLLLSGIGLHQVHQISAATSVPVALFLHAAESERQ